MNNKIQFEENGKVRVFDEFAVSREINYQDNILEVLANENILETLEAEYNNLQKEKENTIYSVKKLKQERKKHQKDRKMFYIFQFVIFPIIMIITTFSLISIMGISTALLGISIGVVGELIFSLLTLSVGKLYQDIKNKQKITEMTTKISGLTVELKALSYMLKKEREKYHKIKDIRTYKRQEERENKVLPVRYKDELFNKRLFIRKMYQYGCNPEGYNNVVHHEEVLEDMYNSFNEEMNPTLKKHI